MSSHDRPTSASDIDPVDAGRDDGTSDHSWVDGQRGETPHVEGRGTDDSGDAPESRHDAPGATASPDAARPLDAERMGMSIFEAYEAIRRARRWVAASQAPPLSRRARQWRQGIPRRQAPKANATGPLPRTTDFTEQTVRDLSWLLRSPPLLARSAFAELLADPFAPALFGPDPAAAMALLLQRLERDPTPLAATQASGRERRLGRYAERLFSVWLGEVPDLKRIAMGLPVREPQPGGRTLGECDALFQTPTGAFEHWELAVKFYLEIDDGAASPSPSTTPPSGPLPDLRGCDRYVGAGLADRFDWKLQRLLRHQLPLSAHPALQVLAPGPWTPRMFVKGRLFYPLNRWQGVDCGAGVPALATDHPRGWWATLSEWLTWSYHADCRWTSLERMDWLAPLRLDDPAASDPGAGMPITGHPPAGASEASGPSGQHPFDGAGVAGAGREGEGGPSREGVDAIPAARIYDAVAFARMLHAHFDSDLPSSAMPRQVAALTLPSPGQPAREMSRGFIVPDSWPARARVFSRLPAPG